MNTPTQEFSDDGEQHRLVAQDGRKTEWAGYRAWAYLDGWVGHTAFYGMREAVVRADDFCRDNGAALKEPS